MSYDNKNVTRKDFLKGMGTTIAGVTLFGGLSSVLTGCSQEEVAMAEAPQTLEPDAVTYPVAYTHIDPDKAAERAYKNYKEKGG